MTLKLPVLEKPRSRCAGTTKNPGAGNREGCSTDPAVRATLPPSPGGPGPPPPAHTPVCAQPHLRRKRLGVLSNTSGRAAGSAQGGGSPHCPVAGRPPTCRSGPRGGPRADVHVIVLVLRLLLHGQFLQRGVHVQLVGLQLPEQRLPLREEVDPSAPSPCLASLPGMKPQPSTGGTGSTGQSGVAGAAPKLRMWLRG